MNRRALLVSFFAAIAAKWLPKRNTPIPDLPRVVPLISPSVAAYEKYIRGLVLDVCGPASITLHVNGDPVQVLRTVNETRALLSVTLPEPILIRPGRDSVSLKVDAESPVRFYSWSMETDSFKL